MAHLLSTLLSTLFPKVSLETEGVNLPIHMFSFDDEEEDFGGDDFGSEEDFDGDFDEEDEDWFPGDDENGDDDMGFGSDEDFNY